MARTKQKKRKTEEFEVKHDYIPDFLKALGELAELYEKEDDFRATALRRGPASFILNPAHSTTGDSTE